MKIVVVEDEIRTRKGIVQLINQISTDYQIVGEASNGIEGEKIVVEKKPDLIITDIKMHDMSGLDMLDSLKRYNLKHKAIILSGYSEFEYAKKAIKVGVYEYLLKPFTVDDLQRVLNDIEKLIKLEKSLEESKTSESVSLDFILNSIFLGSDLDITGLAGKMKTEYDLDITKNFCVGVVYLDRYNENASKKVIGLVEEYLRTHLAKQHYLYKISVENTYVIILPDNRKIDDFKRVIQNQLLKEIYQPQSVNTIFGFIKCENINNFTNSLSTLKRELQWSIVLGEDVLIDHDKIKQIVTKIVKYPIVIERRMILAVHSLDLEKIEACCYEFLKCWRKDLYQPDDVINAFVQFSSAMINTAKKVSSEWENSLSLKETYQRMINSFTWKELSGSLIDLVAIMSLSIKTHNNDYSLVIKKALNIIDLHLHERITQVEVADKLNVTPEYLSMLFAKEVGRNFNTYIKEIKINKAKELLLKGDMNTFTISQKLGFTDSKYFYKVFKEVTGLSTSDYIKINRN
ncbi:response regulator transcription factor [Paenibacillus periandrae]|uniref:response regulator transcription factor n=1 Tax=Paenibacillus periandrae TaxID=1761741 RepID=UPI001F09C664|nr:response regulator [Paenibacillus periandrae]